MLERAPDKWDERLEVVRNAEVFEGEIAWHLVIRIPIAREIIGADWHAAEGEVGAHTWGEQLTKDAVPLLRVEGGERCPAEFVEARAEPFDRLLRALRLHDHIW